MPISAGDHLGPYEILSPIGAGGMGEVWKARDKRLDRIVAIKTSARNFSERFEREARAIAALNHPHICQIYDVGPDYLVMEYIEGQPISGPLPLDLALKAAIQLAAALEAAHRKSIVHRDLKPANILTTKSGVKVLDFGLAKLEVPANAPTDETQTRALTQEGTIVGTLQYMAPEQLQGKPVDPRSDIFAFGCVLYEILTGKRAFRGENQATLIASIIDRDPEPISLHQPMIPPMLERVVKKCLAKDPDDRWQTASDLKSELQWILDGGSNAAMPPRLWNVGAVTPTSDGWSRQGSQCCSLPRWFSISVRSLPRPPRSGSRSRFRRAHPGGRSIFPSSLPTGRAFYSAR
jgi:eukaryotic-like serine/threonine-protein kinase